MSTPTDWEATVSNLLKSELKRKGMTYADLSTKLEEIGVKEREANIRNKIGRKRFTAVFFAQCLSAMGSDKLRLD